MKISTMFSECLHLLCGSNNKLSNCFMNISYQSVPQYWLLLSRIMVSQDNPFPLHYPKIKHWLKIYYGQGVASAQKTELGMRKAFTARGKK